MKTSYSKWTIVVLGFCAIVARAHAADQMQTITLNVPVEINWPQADVGQAFVQGPPFLKCYLTGASAPSNPTSMDWLAIAVSPDNGFLGTASSPLMVDSSGHYSGTVVVNFSVSAATYNKSNNHAYWCYLASSNKKNAQLRDYANGRGLKVDVDQANAWKSINK